MADALCEKSSGNINDQDELNDIHCSLIPAHTIQSQTKQAMKKKNNFG